MGRLRLRRADTGADETRDSLPFPSVWSEMQREERRAPDQTEAAVAEIERAIERLQKQVDDLQEEVDCALHLPDSSGPDWPPRAA